MSEIEKLYKIAGVEPKYKDYRTKNGKTYEDKNPNNRNIRLLYPPFTPQKQLELIKWLSNNDKDKNKEMCIYNSSHPYFYFGLYHNEDIEDNSYGYGESLTLTFEEGIAKLINNLWQDLTESEQEQIRSILKG